MKLLYTLLFAITLAGTYTSSAQSTHYFASTDAYASGPIYIKHYEKLKELYIKQLQTGSYKNLHQLHVAFGKKTNYKGSYTDIASDLLGWIKNNISQTFFGSYENAEKEWNAIVAASQDEFKENADFYSYKNKAVQECGQDVYRQVTNDVREEYPYLFMK